MINKKVNTIGRNIIIFAWAGSPVVGVIFCWRNMEAPINSVSTGIPYGGAIKGTVKGKVNNLSGAERSLIHKAKGACRNSIEFGRIR